MRQTGGGAIVWLILGVIVVYLAFFKEYDSDYGKSGRYDLPGLSFQDLAGEKSERLKNQYTVREHMISGKDCDGDGIDDQTDILQGALEYVAGKPRYRSKYYASGYPDDNYGVCTDVVAFAMRNAGYDLMQLVGDDVAANPSVYDIVSADRRIDFRRVKNLKVYFSRYAMALTTDIYDIDAWQGGDIVIFQDHIGIVSDRRNQNGVAYVIHLTSGYQRTYEQDILEQRKDLVAHYRVSE